MLQDVTLTGKTISHIDSLTLPENNMEENVRLEPSSCYRPSEELPQSCSLDLWNWQTVATKWKGQALGFYGRACSGGFDVAFSFWSTLVSGSLLLLMAGVPPLSMALSGLWDMRLKDHSVLRLWMKSCLGCKFSVDALFLLASCGSLAWCLWDNFKPSLASVSCFLKSFIHVLCWLKPMEGTVKFMLVIIATNEVFNWNFPGG